MHAECQAPEERRRCLHRRRDDAEEPDQRAELAGEDGSVPHRETAEDDDVAAIDEQRLPHDRGQPGDDDHRRADDEDLFGGRLEADRFRAADLGNAPPRAHADVRHPDAGQRDGAEQPEERVAQVGAAARDVVVEKRARRSARAS